MLRTALHVANALTPQLLLEVRLAAPRGVLPPLVGEDLLRRSVVGNPACQRLHHQHRALMVRERVRHDEARVIVHEGREVQTLMASQQKREDVRLPELIRCSALEAPRWVLARRRRLRRLGDQSLLVQDPPDLCLTHTERAEARQHVADPPRARFGVRTLLCHHRVPLRRRRRRRRPRRRGPHGRRQRVHSAAFVERDPLLDGARARTEDARRLDHARPAQHRLDHSEPERQRICPPPTRHVLPTATKRAAAALGSSSPFAHLRLSLPRCVSEGRREVVLDGFGPDQTLIKRRAAQASGTFFTTSMRCSITRTIAVGIGRT